MRNQAIEEIKSYPSNITIIHNSGDQTIIDTDDRAGLFTEKEWREDPRFNGLSKNEIDDVIFHLGLKSNADFFAQEG